MSRIYLRISIFFFLSPLNSKTKLTPIECGASRDGQQRIYDHSRDNEEPARLAGREKNMA